MLKNIIVACFVSVSIWAQNHHTKSFFQSGLPHQNKIIDSIRALKGILKVFNRIQKRDNFSSIVKTKSTEVNSYKYFSSEFNLSQNYPESFKDKGISPTTTIRFSTPSAVNVVVGSYSVLGEKVTTLLHELLTGGKYRKRFSAVGLPSSICFSMFVTAS